MMDILSPSFHSSHKFMTTKSYATATTSPAQGIAPPSPRHSMDEAMLQKELQKEKEQQQEHKEKGIVSKEIIVETIVEHQHAKDDAAVIVEALPIQTPPSPLRQEQEPEKKLSSKPVMTIDTQVTKRVVSFPFKSPAVLFDHDPSGYLVTKLQSLMYWEHPAQSFGVLFGLLGSVYLSQSYSLLYLASAAFTLITAFNWVYVNLHYHSHRVLSGKPAEVIVHPHSDALSMRDARRTWFTEEQVNHSCQVALNVLEGVVEQVMELVLIEDSWRSGCAVAISFILWTLASLISTKSLVVLLTVLFFTVPRLYLEHQVDVDAYALHQQNRVKSWLKEHQQQQVILYKLSERAQTLALQVASKGMQLTHTLYSQWANRKSAVSIVTEQPMDHAK